MTAVKSGLMIVDQHRAHVRMLFEQYQKQLAARKIHAQKMLFPETLQLSAREETILNTIHEEVAAMGFELTGLGSGTYALNAVPEGFEGVDVLRLVHDMLLSAEEKGASVKHEIQDTLALSLAKAAAIPYGQVLSNDEMEHVINGLFLCSNVNYTPDGKSILYILRQEEIEQKLK